MRLSRVLKKLGPDRIPGNLTGLEPADLLAGFDAVPAPPRRPRATPQALQFPLKSARRIAILRPGFSPSSNAREFAAQDAASLLAWGPDAAVAPLNTALLLADHKLGGKFEIPTLDMAITVLTRIDDAPLAPHHRDLLWRAFEVPVFEQLLSWDGTVIARECELHAGLHVAEEAAIATIRDEELLLTHLDENDEPIVLARTGYFASLNSEPCDCGSTSPRLTALVTVRTRVQATE